MREIDLVDAFNLMRLCDGVILEGRHVDLSLIGIEHEDDHEFAYISWSEHIQDQWVDFDVVFKEGDNQKVLIDGSSLTLFSSEGEEEVLVLLKEWPAESASGWE